MEQQQQQFTTRLDIQIQEQSQSLILNLEDANIPFNAPKSPFIVLFTQQEINTDKQKLQLARHIRNKYFNKYEKHNLKFQVQIDGSIEGELVIFIDYFRQYFLSELNKYNYTLYDCKVQWQDQLPQNITNNIHNNNNQIQDCNQTKQEKIQNKYFTDDIQLDPSKKYYTKLLLKICGRAIAIDLSKCELPSKKRGLHATVIFRNSGYSAQELQRVIELGIKFRQIKNKEYFQFTLPQFWGKNSAFIEGELVEFITYVRNQCTDICENNRIPHVSLR